MTPTGGSNYNGGMGVLVLMIGLLPFDAGSAAGGQAAGHPRADMAALLARYFEAASTPKDRAKLAADIEDAAGGDASLVAAALPSVPQWSDVPHEGQIAISGLIGEPLRIRWMLPQDYDPALAYPLLFCIPGIDADAATTIRTAQEVLQAASRGLVICAPDRGLPDRNGTAVRVRTALTALRRRLHLDPARTYLFGSDQGADAAWMMALGQPDLFAGAVLFSGYPPWPYAEQAYAVMLPNLSAMPVLSFWPDESVVADRSSTMPDSLGRGTQTRSEMVAVHNRAMASYAGLLSLPITSVPLPMSRRTAFDVTLGGAVSADLLRAPRRLRSRRVAHWYRYPDQGRVGCLQLVEFRGEVWEHEQIDILPAGSVDRTQFITQVLQNRLGYLGGAIEKNVIDITTRRAARIEVLLTPDLIDFSQPVRVICNGIKRFDGPVTPSIPLMLESVWETWDFQHPVWASLTFNIQADAEP